MLTKRVSREELVARLRESRKEYEHTMYESGKEAGSDFAEKYADYKTLITIAKALEDDQRWKPIECEDLVFAITGERNSNAHAFFGQDYESMSDPDFMRGFADGAMEVWNSVRDEVGADESAPCFVRS